MRFIWATRGHAWGFRFLRRGGFDDPLGVYDAAFLEVADQPEVYLRSADNVAVRFPDPLGRRDAFGRVIPHDFVILEPPEDVVNSVADGIRLIWPLVADEFEQVWMLSDPPTAFD